jgi:hypothetical protein
MLLTSRACAILSLFPRCTVTANGLHAAVTGAFSFAWVAIGHNVRSPAPRPPLAHTPTCAVVTSLQRRGERLMRRVTAGAAESRGGGRVFGVS